MNVRRQRFGQWASTIGTGGCLLGLIACGNSEASRTNGSEQPPTISPPSTPPPPSDETFAQMQARLEAEKPIYMDRQHALLDTRYDLSDRPSRVQMTRGKAVQAGVRVILPPG